MSPTRRQNILTNILSALNAISEVTTAEINRKIPVQNDADLPFAIITSGSETLDLEESSLGSELYEWDIPIIVITKTTDIEELLGLIHVKLLEDMSRGTYADKTRRVASEMSEDFNIPNGASAMVLTYRITYDIEEGSV